MTASHSFRRRRFIAHGLLPGGLPGDDPPGDQPVRRAQPFDEVEVAEDVRAVSDRSLGFVATGEQTDDGVWAVLR